MLWWEINSSFLQTIFLGVLGVTGLFSDSCDVCLLFQVEFSRGLVVLAMEKLLHDIPNMVFDEQIFSHMIDEVLSFDKDLKNSYGYPESLPGCLHILTQETCFDKWLRVEKKCEFRLQNHCGSERDTLYPRCGQIFTLSLWHLCLRTFFCAVRNPKTSTAFCNVAVATKFCSVVYSGCVCRKTFRCLGENGHDDVFWFGLAVTVQGPEGHHRGRRAESPGVRRELHDSDGHNDRCVDLLLTGFVTESSPKINWVHESAVWSFYLFCL